MALLNRDDWYDIGRDVDWTLSYVDRWPPPPGRLTTTHRT